MRWVVVSLVSLAAGCGPAEPEPRTTVHVDAVAGEPIELGEESAPPVVSTMEDAVGRHCGEMTPEEPVHGNPKDGDPFEHLLLLMPGRCYAVVAVAEHGGPLELSLVANIPDLPVEAPVLAEGIMEENAAVLGGVPNCFKNALPIPMQARLVVSSKRATPVAVVVCSR